MLLTGATGFVGTELIARWLERTDRCVYALVRGESRQAAQERLRETLAVAVPDPERFAERVRAVPGDICTPGLGLEDGVREWLAEQVTEIVHSAASVSFTLPVEDSRAINVDGTRRMLELAERCARRGAGLERFAYVSTAYVAGTHQGSFHEDELDVGQGFRNPYERTKFEAEKLVRERRDRLPIQIFRPSIIVGEASTGWTAAFNVLYSPLRTFARGALPILPARLSAPVDVVPVDYVADAVFALCQRPVGQRETYHLVAGGQASTIDRLTRMASSYYRRPAPPVLPVGAYRRVLHPLLVRYTSGRRAKALRTMEAFFPYLGMRVRFDNRRARRRLSRAGIAPPPLESYFRRLLDFAERAGWGRSEVTRPEAAAGSRAPVSTSV